MWVGGGFGGGEGADLIVFWVGFLGNLEMMEPGNDALLRLTHPTSEGIGDFGWGNGGWWNIANRWGFCNIRV